MGGKTWAQSEATSGDKMLRLSVALSGWLSTIALGASVLMSSLANAQEPNNGKCTGVLHKDKFGIHFGGGRGEDEGICAISKSEESKVLAICHVGSSCEVYGVVDDCKESGECVEITNIGSVRRKR
jgi:hypothetical protein